MTADVRQLLDTDGQVEIWITDFRKIECQKIINFEKIKNQLCPKNY